MKGGSEGESGKEGENGETGGGGDREGGWRERERERREIERQVSVSIPLSKQAQNMPPTRTVRWTVCFTKSCLAYRPCMIMCRKYLIIT